MKILIIRMKGIGDVLMSWFGLEALRQKYPHAEIIYVTSKANACLFYGQGDLVDRIIPIDWDYPAHGVPNLPKEILEIPHDVLIDLTNRVDFHDIIEEFLGDRNLLHLNPRADNFASLMRVNIDHSIPFRYLKIPEESNRRALERIRFCDRTLISCQLDAMGATRNWRTERWIQLSELLVNEGFSVIWFSLTPVNKSLY